MMIDLLREALSYDPESGALNWKKRPVEHFSNERISKIWNSKYSGKPALTSINSSGYKAGKLFDKTVMAHRIIWALVNGEWPEEIDHINGNCTDNRMVNLRAATRLINMRNLKRLPSNTSGVSGVRWRKRENIWEASIRTGDGRIQKFFKTREEAVVFRKAKEVEYSYHPNHGRP